MKYRALIIGDELAVIQTAAKHLIRIGHTVKSALSVAEALDHLDDGEYDVVFFDLKLARYGGSRVLEKLKSLHPTTAVVILHGMSSLAAAEVLGYGVYEFLLKPLTPEALFAAFHRAVQQRNMMLQARSSCTNETVAEFGELIGNGPAMRALFRLIMKVAPTGVTVLMIGPLGSGKKLAARAVHKISNRRGEPFLIFESGRKSGLDLSKKLFGEETRQGMRRTLTPGKIDEAESGTLYFAEVAALDSWGQTQLVNAIQTRSYLPVNGSEPRPANCRFVLATSSDLKSIAEHGGIIKELYQNVDVFPIYLPSLAERSEDIPALTYQFMRAFAKRFDKNIEMVDDRLMTRLIAYPWPGNVRQLENCIERMVAVCHDEILTLEHYQQVMEGSGLRVWDGRTPTSIEELKDIKKELRKAAIREVERSFIINSLQKACGNVTHAAQEVGMQRRNFQAMMKEYGIKSG